MDDETYTFSADVRVYDKAELYRAALAQCIKDGDSEEGARKSLMDGESGEINCAACIQTLMDPGLIESAGIEIEESRCE